MQPATTSQRAKQGILSKQWEQEDNEGQLGRQTGGQKGIDERDRQVGGGVEPPLQS